MLKFWFLSIFLARANGEDAFFNINNRIWHKVSDKFLSISIDPAVLLAGVNLSEVSLILAKHLSPAYIRLAGPSTQFVKYIDNEDEATPYKDEGDDLIITPSMWFGINEWFNLASLTPVFGINDRETEKDVWDPKSTVPLFEMSDKFGVSCYWQLGYGCSNKTIVQYVEGLNILKQTLLSGFPEHNETWKIVGSDLSACNSNGTINNLQSYIRDLDETVDAVMRQSPFPPKREQGPSNAAQWVSIPKDVVPVTFQSAMEWAIKVGQAATLEYDVVFREPRLLEITHDTPVYWFSFLYKKLMGSNVLEIKSPNQISDLAVFAHCTKRQNSFVRSGAVTIMVVNNGSEPISGNVRLGSILLEKSMEIQSYCLTASNENVSQVLLNDRTLTMDMLKRADDILQPKLRRAKIRPHIFIEAPPQTITFFILTGAKFPVCTKNEDDLASILDEINEDQDVEQEEEEEIQFNIEGRHQNYLNRGEKLATGGTITLQNIKKSILKEMELDKSYYDKITKNTRPGSNFVEIHHKEMDNEMRETLHKHLRTFIEKSKRSKLIKDTKKENPGFKKNAPKNLHLTIQEIEDILKHRAKAKAAARNIKLTSSELDMLVNKATLKIPKHFVTKKDINRVLLEEKANYYKNNLFTQEMFEDMAKERKMYPKFKFRRSVGANSRAGRDINLDLLKKRTEPTTSHFGRSRVVVQPTLKHRKHGFSNKKQQKYAPLNLDADSDEDYFDDLMRFEERAFADFTSPKDSFTDLDSLDLDKLEDFFKKTKDKYASPSARQGYYYSEKIKVPKTKSKLVKVNSDEYLQFLQSSAESQSCEDEFGFSVAPKSAKEIKLKASKPGNIKKEPSLCADFGELSFSNDMDYDFLRRKREAGAITKEKLRSLKKDMLDEIKKLKHQLKDDKVKYLKEKLKNKLELKKQKYSDKSLLTRKHKTSIQVIPKHAPEKTTENVNIDDIIAKANSEENTIPPSLDHQITKRSLSSNHINEIFGRYKPRTSELKAWKPSDILSLNNNNYLPVYSWVHDSDNMPRKRRYIEGNSINYDKNELYDSKLLKKADKKDYKLLPEKHNDFAEARFEPDELGRVEKNGNSKTIRNKSSTKLAGTDLALPAANKEIFDKNVANIDKKLILPEESTYLDPILGTKNVKPIQNFVQNVKGTFDKFSNDIKDFFKKLF